MGFEKWKHWVIVVAAAALVSTGMKVSARELRGQSPLRGAMPTNQGQGVAPIVRYAPGELKWHPGHYVTLMHSLAPDPKHMADVIDELARHPTLRGLQIRYGWAELEPTPGNYDFSRIERDLDLLAATGRHLFILLQTKSFTASTPMLPKWLSNDIRGGGTFQFYAHGRSDAGRQVAEGRNIKLWNPLVRERLQALVRELGRRFNQHPALEGIALTETALGQPVVPINASQIEAFFANLIAVHATLRTVFPNTVTMQFVNYPKNVLATFVPALRDFTGAMGGPDILLDDPGLHSGVYPKYALLAGQVPLGPSVQSENYRARVHNGPEDPPAIDELYRFGRDQLFANYMFWTRETSPDYNPYSAVLEYLSSPGFRNDAAGGLNASCPWRYERCVE